MEDLRDDPIIDSILRTGYPPWYAPRNVFHPFMLCYEDDEEWEEEDADVFYGNETEDF